ncbi:lactonase family protein [Nibrella saemangeumensis]|uniref:Lactonase family protein n=1 Tax=Nibrella saemangeumensis TaxID=1084526 RepID=A0ABP8MBI4_9BACT
MKLLTILLFLFPMLAQVQAQPKEILYVGTYSTRGSEGIYVYSFDRKTGALERLQGITQGKSPSFLAVHPSGRFLYAVNEGDQQGENKSGTVSAYRIDPATGKLTYINQQSSHGGAPCHISIDKTGKLAFISNYSGGSLTMLPIAADGSLGTETDHVQHNGSGANKSRQEKPHVHSAILSPDERFVYVSDLGTDKVYIYEIDKAKGKLKPAQTPHVSVAPGSGPRHFTIHPNGKYAYLVEEIISAVASFSRDSKTGALTLMQDQVKALKDEFDPKNSGADIHTDPMGRYLYESIRGKHLLAIFSIGNDGKIQLIGQQDTQGKTPRNFLVDDRGEFVLAANQDSDNVVVFKLEAKTGKLTPTGTEIKVPAPVCLKMLTLK